MNLRDLTEIRNRGPDWPKLQNASDQGITQDRCSSATRTIRSSTSLTIGGLPRPRRTYDCERQAFGTTPRWRPAGRQSPSALPLIRWPISPSVARSPFDSVRLPFNWPPFQPFSSGKRCWPKNPCLRRQQLLVLQRRYPEPRLRKPDRQLWICASRWFTSWRSSLLIVKPERPEVALMGLVCLLAWRSNQQPRSAAVSIFGYTGRSQAAKRPRVEAPSVVM
jgi:hypothetical protein